MKNEKIKNVILGVLLVGLIGMTTAYALLSQRLDINSTAKVKSGSWDIHFANLVKGDVTGNAVVKTEPTLSNTSIQGLDVELTKPGDSVVYTFEIYNSGTIDAKISSFKINSVSDGIVCTDAAGQTSSEDATNTCSNLNYALTYAEDTTEDATENIISAGSSISEDQMLLAGQKVKMKLEISYTGSFVPGDDITVTGLDSYIIYEQK